MNKYMRFAFNHHLSEYPEDWTYQQIVNAILERDDKVVVWQYYDEDGQDMESIVFLIDDMIVGLTDSFADENEDTSWLDDLYSFTLPTGATNESL